MKRAYAAACAVVTAVVSVGAAGCTQDAGVTAATAATGPEERLRRLNHREELLLSDAEHLLIKRCMARLGFPYYRSGGLTPEEQRPVGYVQDDVGWARKHGYGSRILEKGNRARLDNPNAAYRKTLSAKRSRAYARALNGGKEAKVLSAEVPGGGTIRKRVGGCSGEAEEQLYGDLGTWFTADKVADNLQGLYVGDVLADKRFTTVVGKWSRCMKRAGHHYADPGEAREAVRQQAGEIPRDEAFEAERKIAAADATCARETSLRAVAEEREAHYIDKLRGEYGTALDTAGRIQRDALARAGKIVGARSRPVP